MQSMAELKYDFTACIVSGGSELLTRINSARAEYSGMSGDYFDYISGKYGKPTFTQSACGFILAVNHAGSSAGIPHDLKAPAG